MSMYRENIIEHYKNPENHEAMDDATTEFRDKNPLCGDDIRFWLKIDEEGKVEKATFLGEGCAISQASASILTEELVGLTVDEIDKMGETEMRENLGVQLSPVRLKCALLSIKVVQGAVLKYRGDQVSKKSD